MMFYIFNQNRQYVPPKKVITIDFSSIDDCIYDIKPPLDVSLVEERCTN